MKNIIDGGGTIADNPGDHVPHQPVLYHEVLDALSLQSDRIYVDGTLGAGGHAEGILNYSAPKGKLLGLDLDPEALAIARRRLLPFEDRIALHQASYHMAPEILQELGWLPVHGILLDLGVSSMQLDQPERGFSFMSKGPLDMRFNQANRPNAAEIVNTLNKAALSEIIWKFGEERYARKIARAIVASRPINDTRTLADVIQKAVPRHPSHIHPATRTFQAIRIATNKELETLADALPKLVKIIAPGGRIAVISFHSLEDRMIKRFFRMESQDCICPPEQPICTCDHKASLKVITKKPVTATQEEIDANSRARSAKLRIAQKLGKA
ncbi:MAG: 16S rRNA (cytosine(1402)-N(4))-methyltransferase RsmH [Chloroflexota bacterium]|nr:16S rRNA (cytosine(1402)-N(4))-methyltransferase RsmH [Chloroflexota bacterium]